MPNKQMSETLTQFGTSFQSKIIALLLTNKSFLQTISDILKSKYFDSDANKWLVGTIIGKIILKKKIIWCIRHYNLKFFKYKF